jgi:hypothetical protein
VFLAQKVKNQSHDSSRGEGSKRGRGKNNFKDKGVGIIKVRDMIFIVFIVDTRKINVGSHGRISKKIRNKGKIKVKILIPLIFLLLIAILA